MNPSITSADYSEPLLPKQEEEEEDIVLLELVNSSDELEHDEDGEGQATVLLIALYGLFFLQYFLLFQNDVDTGLEPWVVYSTIVLFAMASYLFNDMVVSSEFSKALEFVPEMLIVSSMALTFQLESAVPGFLWLVAGTCGLATTVVVFQTLQLCCRAPASNSEEKSLGFEEECQV